MNSVRPPLERGVQQIDAARWGPGPNLFWPRAQAKAEKGNEDGTNSVPTSQSPGRDMSKKNGIQRSLSSRWSLRSLTRSRGNPNPGGAGPGQLPCVLFSLPFPSLLTFCASPFSHTHPDHFPTRKLTSDGAGSHSSAALRCACAPRPHAQMDFRLVFVRSIHQCRYAFRRSPPVLHLPVRSCRVVCLASLLSIDGSTVRQR